MVILAGKAKNGLCIQQLACVFIYKLKRKVASEVKVNEMVIAFS